MAQLGTTNMQIPIQYAMTYPARVTTPVKRLDLTRIGQLNFQQPDRKKFLCVDLAYEAGEKGGTYPAVLNAANEVAVSRFLSGEIAFMSIPKIIDKVLSK